MLVKKKSEAWRWLKTTLIIFLFVLAAGGTVYAVFYSPLFLVKSIEVKGASIAPAQILAGRGYANILFTFPQIDVSKFPEVASFTVSKDYWNRKVVIEAKERERAMIWCLEQTGTERASRCFWTDRTGLIFSDAPEPSGGGAVKVIQDASGRDLGINDYAIPQDEFANLSFGLNIFDELRVPVSSVRIDNVKFGEFTVLTTGGPKVYFSLLFDPREDYDAIRTLTQSDGWKKLCYVDLRTTLRVYTSKSCLN